MRWAGERTGSTSTVELLWWEGCPSTEAARRLCREEMGAAGLDPEALAEREIRDDDDAARERFVGSPTIRVDGRDVEDPGGQPPSLSCRVYRLADGRFSPLPERRALREALRTARRPR